MAAIEATPDVIVLSVTSSKRAGDSRARIDLAHGIGETTSLGGTVSVEATTWSARADSAGRVRL